MPCYPLKDDAGRPIGIACTRGRSRQKPCAYCGRPSSRLCDFPVLREGKRGTCDTSLCDRCTSRIAGDGDLCRAHAPLWDRALNKATVGPGAEGPSR